ncbi:MAG: type II secretion system protein, partial [Desulfuromonadales bacterium]|nr:type II secretion system protein [Desulfuromonadales bacterium]
PITLKFKDTEIRDVFNILSRLSGINFLFDDDIRAQKVSILLENATFAQALELLLRLNNLDRKVLNAKTILIYPQTKEKEKKFEDQIIQTFYLSNIDAKKAVNLLRTMLQLRKIYVHEELNALVIRDTPTTITLAQQIIEAADRSDAEVVFELELVEVSHTDSLDIGARLSNYGTSFGLADPSSQTIGTVTTSGLSRLDFLYTIPSGSFTFKKQMTDSEILANPKIRVKNKEKAKVHIGSREPIVTNTLTASGDVTSTNVQYVDVGVKLDVEPLVQLDNTVVTKLSLEVSNVSSRQKIGDSGRGGEALTISTTNAQTSLILRDGEQTVIGGLIRDDLSRSKETFPLLGQIPLLGHLLSGHKKDKTKREILLSITPYIVKSVEMPRREVATIWSGGEDDLEVGPRFGAFAASFEPEVSKVHPAAAPAVHVPALAVQPSAAIASTELAAGRPELATMVEEEETAVERLPEATAPASGGMPDALPPPAEQPAQLRLIAPSHVQLGEEVFMAVQVENIRGLYSAPLFVTYDPQQLTFLRAEEGDFLKATGQRTIFTVSTDAQTGRLIVGYKQAVGGAGASGSGNLFHLVFQGKAPGQGQVALDRLNFRDPAGNRLAVTGTQVPVEIR